MIKIIKKVFKEIDDQVKNIMINGFKFSFIFCVFSSLILLTYNISMIPNIYYVGIILFKSSLMFFVTFIVLGIGFDKLKKQIAKM